MTLLIKAAVTVIVGALMSLLLRRSAPELGLAVSISVSLLAAAFAMELVSGLSEILNLVCEETGLSAAVFAPVMKCVGVGIVTRLSADICRDAGQSAASSAVELCGTACALVTALPLIRSLLKMISEML